MKKTLRYSIIDVISKFYNGEGYVFGKMVYTE